MYTLILVFFMVHFDGVSVSQNSYQFPDRASCVEAGNRYRNTEWSFAKVPPSADQRVTVAVRVDAYCYPSAKL